MSYIFDLLLWLWAPHLMQRRRFDAALGVLRRIRESAGSDSYTRDDLLIQLQALVDFIDQKHLLDHPLGQRSKYPTGAVTVTLRELVDKARAGMDRAAFLAVLNQIEALLQIRSTISGGHLGGSEMLSAVRTAAPGAGQQELSSSREPPNEPPKPTEPDGLKPDQMAFLWKSTEQLYTSWPFRFLGMLLLAAVLLAGAGTFFIGGQSLQLSQNLKTTASDQTGMLEKIGEQTRKALNAQSDNLKGDADHLQNEIKQKMEKVEGQIALLEGKSDELLKKAVAAIGDKLEANLKFAEETLNKKILDDLEAIKNNDVASLRQKITTLQQSIDGLIADVTKASGQLSANQPGLQLIGRLAPQAEALGEKVAAIHKADSDAKEALTSARQASSQTEATQKELAGRFKPMTSEIDTHQHALGGIQVQLGALVTQIAQAQLNSDRTKQTIDDARRANEVLESLWSRLGEFQKRIAGLEARVPVQPPVTVVPSPPKDPEEKLTREQWRKIQRALAGMNYSLGRIDGKPGDKTREAIKAFQAKSGVPPSGHLTSEQLEKLLRSS